MDFAIEKDGTQLKFEYILGFHHFKVVQLSSYILWKFKTINVRK